MDGTGHRGFAPLMVLLGLAACAAPEPCALPVPQPVERPNLLVVVLDDVGIDQLSAYGVGADPVPTPAIDCLCAQGLRFDQVWGAPLCSPARAALLSGVHPRRDGLGRHVEVDKDDWELPTQRITLAAALAPVGYRSAFLGKWHVSSLASPSGIDHPRTLGFDRFAGTIGNLATGTLRGKQDYTRWEQVSDGVAARRTGYVTSATVDDALDAIATLPEPWLVVLSLHAPHVPLHAPPDELLTTELPEAPDDDELYRAMIEAADTELGRLLRDVDPDVLARTQVWTTSDNGSPTHGIRPPLDPTRSKGTLFEGGVRVPLVVTGAGVGAPGEASDALVGLVDLLPTFLDVGGVPTIVPELDGASLGPLLDDPTLPHHEQLYTDITRKDDKVDRAMRGRFYKVIRHEKDRTQVFAVGQGLDEVELDTWPDAELAPTFDAMDELVDAF